MAGAAGRRWGGLTPRYHATAPGLGLAQSGGGSACFAGGASGASSVGTEPLCENASACFGRRGSTLHPPWPLRAAHHRSARRATSRARASGLVKGVCRPVERVSTRREPRSWVAS